MAQLRAVRDWITGRATDRPVAGVAPVPSVCSAEGVRVAWLRSLPTLGLDLLFPPACRFCGCDLAAGDESALFCPGCWQSLAGKERACCPLCGTWRASGDSASSCAACAERPWRFDAVVSLGDYAGDLRDAVLRAKRPPGEPLALALGALLAQRHLSSLREWHLDCVLPIPMHWTRRFVRGGNSAELLARQVARALDAPLGDALRRHRRTVRQGPLSPSRRALNVRGAFRVARPEDFRAARVLIVDDVITSGATCGEAARVLKQAGAEFVAVAAIARTQPPR